MSINHKIPTELLKCGSISIIAPHNDDEVLGCFHLMQKLPSSIHIQVILVTCHDNSLTLTNTRRLESLNALESLPNVRFEYWNLPDGNVKGELSGLTQNFISLLTTTDFVLCPAISDLTPDHIPIADTALKQVPAKRLIWYRSTWWTFQMRNADFVVSGSFRDKWRAIKKFESQKHIKLKRCLWLSCFEHFLYNFRPTSAEAFLFADEKRLSSSPLNSISLRHLYRVFFW
ncbi:PIG-L family deacetylase [Octadecabacter sp.]|nr:PIG-L family deacetylase [Octadecabacter sp.]